MRALVIDDSRAMRSLVGRTLRELGYEIVEAGNGRDGLDVLERNRPLDVVLVDWHMPEMDGFEFVRTVRASPENGELTVLMVTSVSEGEQVARALEAGASDFIMKPFTREALIERLRMLGLGQGGR